MIPQNDVRDSYTTVQRKIGAYVSNHGSHVELGLITSIFSLAAKPSKKILNWVFRCSDI